MFDASTELAPDIEWLLTSGEKDPQLLADLLVHEYYLFLYDLMLGLGFTEPFAKKILIKTMVNAILNRRLYSADHSGRAWLVRLLLREIGKSHQDYIPENIAKIHQQWHSLMSLSTSEITALLLFEIFQWPLAEINKACSIEPARLEKIPQFFSTDKKPLVKEYLTTISSRANSQFDSPRTLSSLQQTADEIANSVEQRQHRQRVSGHIKEVMIVAIVILVGLFFFRNTNYLFLEIDHTEITPEAPLSPSPTPLWMEKIAYVVAPGDTIESIAALAGMKVEALRRLNRIPSGTTLDIGQPLWIAIPELTLPLSYAVYDSSLKSYESLPPEADLQTVLERVQISHRTWHSLWADYQIAQYIPRSSDQEPRYYRSQVWVSQPYRSNELFGDLSNPPIFRHVILNGRSYNSAARFSGAYLDPNWRHPPRTLVYSKMLRAFIFPDSEGLFSLPRPLLELCGFEEIAGRSTFCLEQSSFSEQHIINFWVDAQYGTILRRQVVEAESRRVITDVIATQILFNIPIAEQVFDPRSPWEGSFVSDATNRSVPFNEKAPTITPAFHALPPHN